MATEVQIKRELRAPLHGDLRMIRPIARKLRNGVCAATTCAGAPVSDSTSN